ncbi:V-type ATP synthase subunit I [Negativibacillus massiliensis]|uniref:V-type ATP synthase subunit I n=1 Tax=Negativibacillus massiliensis TaxID=1871035 RepID=UPI000337E0FF|nr:archaeal/vacuolar-type H+-ATPase subunit I [Clostridium sp. CAG:242]
MILKMQKLTLIGFLADKESILRDLMKKKCVQINGPENIQDYESIAQLAVPGVAQTYELEQELTKFTSAIRAVAPYEEKGSAFSKKEISDFSSMLDKEIYSEAASLRDEINSIVKQIAEQKNIISRSQLQITSLEPWTDLDLDLSVTQTKSTALLYLTAAADVNLEEFEAKLQEATPLCYVHKVSSSSELSCLLLIYHKDAQDAVMNVVKGFNTNRPDFASLKGNAAENISSLKNKIETCSKEAQRLTEQLKVAATSSKLLKKGFDMVTLQIDDQKVRENIFQTQSVFALTGWLTENDMDKVKKILDKYPCYYTMVQPEEGDDPPIKLKNNKFVEPYEMITEMYSLPTPDGIDPTPVLTPFFILFFGMMLADAGYGLILFLLCFIGLKKLKPDEGFLKNAMNIGVACGLSTIFWGVMYGGYFGNLVTQVAESWFGVTVTVPAVFDPLNDPMSVMLLSLILGAIHLFAGMGVKIYMLAKRGHLLDGLMDIGLWYVLLIGLPMLALPVTAGIGKVLSIVGAVGLILTQGRHEKNIFMKLIKGVMSLYDITSYLSDVLSYARILALGLAGGVIANVMNIMGTMPGLNIIGVVVFVAIFAIGHAFNLAISGLGAYVHTSRLQYVEFFGKFYEAGGRPFKPFKANTKYTLISDKEDK